MLHHAQILLVVALSGSLGAVARYGTVLAATALWGDRFPYGTLVVNVLGCFVIGLAAAALPEPHEKPLMTLWLRYGLVVGFLGAYTTFSAFSLDTLRQLQAGDGLLALLNVAANVTLCLLVVWAGMRLGKEWW